MLASFLVFLRPQQPAPMDKHVGRWLHGLFFHLLAEADPALATRIHDLPGVKPFTASALMGRFVGQGGERVAVPAETYRVRYTVLMPDILAALGQSLLDRYLERRAVRVDETDFTIERIGVAPHERDPWVATTSYEALWQRARDGREITFHFASPTAFRMGDLNLMFPQPWNVFGSLLRTWQAFAPLSLPDDLATATETEVAVSRYQLETQVIQAGRFKLLGFQGQCTYRLLADDPARRRALHALADFALFAGVGMKTGQGMGQVRRTS